MEGLWRGAARGEKGCAAPRGLAAGGPRGGPGPCGARAGLTDAKPLRSGSARRPGRATAARAPGRGETPGGPLPRARSASRGPRVPTGRARSGEDGRARGEAFGPLFVLRRRSPGPRAAACRAARAPAPPAAPAGSAAPHSPSPPPPPSQVGTPRPAARLYLVDVAVGAAADALNQLEVLLRVPAGQIEAGVHGGPGCPPPPSRAGEGGRSGGATRRGAAAAGALLPRRSQSPELHAAAAAPPHAAAANDGDDRANRPRPSQPRRAEPGHTHGERRTLAAPRSG